QLGRFALHPKFVGVRHVLEDEPDARFMMREDFIRGIGKLAALHLTYDLVLLSHHLPVACELVEKFPGQPFVLDHIAKPLIKDRKRSPWEAEIRRLAAFPNVYCKVSGMVTEADWKSWKPADFTPYLDVVFECFGTDRIMIGSDWPVCTLAGSYRDVMQIAADYLERLASDAQSKVWSENAERFYGISDS
ncbi:MAG: amidohydrolase family protein, partial [Acidobacteria bacterium]|nr:amidohydrolase family protein [Acidobacteriota bacterium]